MQIISIPSFNLSFSPKSEETSGLVWKKGSKILRSDGRLTIGAMSGAYGKQTFELTISSIQPSDYDTYTCTAKTTLGSTSKSIELYGTYFP